MTHVPVSLPVMLLAAFFSLPAHAAEEVATASRSNQIHGLRVDVHAAVDRFNMFGVGGRLEFPLAADGFIGGKVRDELALSVGADFLFNAFDRGFYDGGAYAIPIGAAQWNFYLGRYWSVFPEAGVAIHLGIEHEGYGDRARLYLQPDLGVGARFHFEERVALLMRLSTPGGLQLGLTF